MHQWALGVSLLVVLLNARVASAAETDIFGREVPDGRGRYVLVLYSNDETKEAADEPATDLTVRLRDVPLLVVIRVDLRGIPSIFEGIAHRIMKGMFDKGLERYRRRFKALGLNPPKDDEKWLFFVADSYGKAHQAVGLPKGFTEAFAVVFDRTGQELARGPFPKQLAALEAAVRRAEKKDVPPEKQAATK